MKKKYIRTDAFMSGVARTCGLQFRSGKLASIPQGPQGDYMALRGDWEKIGETIRTNAEHINQTRQPK